MSCEDFQVEYKERDSNMEPSSEPKMNGIHKDYNSIDKPTEDKQSESFYILLHKFENDL